MSMAPPPVPNPPQPSAQAGPATALAAEWSARLGGIPVTAFIAAEAIPAPGDAVEPVSDIAVRLAHGPDDHLSRLIALREAEPGDLVPAAVGRLLRSRHYDTESGDPDGPRLLLAHKGPHHDTIRPGDRVCYAYPGWRNPDGTYKTAGMDPPLIVAELIALGDGHVQAIVDGSYPAEYECSADNLKPVRCHPMLPSAQCEEPHAYVPGGSDYGALGDGGSYDRVVCTGCGRVAYSPLPD